MKIAWSVKDAECNLEEMVEHGESWMEDLKSRREERRVDKG